MCGFIAQLVEHHTGIARVTGSNPVEALVFLRLLLSNCLNWKTNCDDHSSRSDEGLVSLFPIWAFIRSFFPAQHFAEQTSSLFSTFMENLGPSKGSAYKANIQNATIIQ